MYKNEQKNDENFWISYADLMAGLLFVFILVLGAIVIKYVYTQSNLEKEKQALNQSQEELINKIRAKHSDFNIDISQQDSVKILEYTDSNRVKTVKFGNHEISGVETRTLLGLKSTNFQITREDGKVKFTVKGYGHGVGMSQTGADTMAKQGSSYEDIIKHFYVGVEIKDINEL